MSRLESGAFFALFAELMKRHPPHAADIEPLGIQTEVVPLRLVIAERFREDPGAPFLQAEGQVATLPRLLLLAWKVLEGEKVHPLKGAQASEPNLAFIQPARVRSLPWTTRRFA